MTRALNLIITILIYGLIALSLLWGTILAIFSFREFIISLTIYPDFFQLVFGFSGLAVWINGIHYIRRIHTLGVYQLWTDFYNKDKKKIILTAILTSVFLFLITVGRSILPYNTTFEKIIQIIQLPWILGGQFNFLISLYTRRFLPFLEPLNNLGWLINTSFQIIAFFYISKIIYWRRAKK
ncbi:hypothetical protein MYX07_04280 [Patescibacteria group bacterium AH-259-L07]|nr:hypothetical protein [Patescibacteria group bacterium AH-259-L07]